MLTNQECIFCCGITCVAFCYFIGFIPMDILYNSLTDCTIMQIIQLIYEVSTHLLCVIQSYLSNTKNASASAWNRTRSPGVQHSPWIPPYCMGCKSIWINYNEKFCLLVSNAVRNRISNLFSTSFI